MSGGMEDCAKMEREIKRKLAEERASKLYHDQGILAKRIGEKFMALLEMVELYKDNELMEEDI